MAGKATKIVGGLSVVTGMVLAIWYFATRPPVLPTDEVPSVEVSLSWD